MYLIEAWLPHILREGDAARSVFWCDYAASRVEEFYALLQGPGWAAGPHDARLEADLRTRLAPALRRLRGLALLASTRVLGMPAGRARVLARQAVEAFGNVGGGVVCAALAGPQDGDKASMPPHIESAYRRALAFLHPYRPADYETLRVRLDPLQDYFHMHNPLTDVQRAFDERMLEINSSGERRKGGGAGPL
jgi:hypothetical protein